MNSTPTLTVNTYLDLLPTCAKAKSRLRQKLVRTLLESVDPEVLGTLPKRGYAVAAHWHWPLDALREAHAQVSDGPRPHMIWRFDEQARRVAA